MKHLLAAILSCTLVFSLFALPACADVPLAGGWSSPENAEITPELQEIFDKALGEDPETVYVPVLLVGTQVVAGMNYCFLCEVHAEEGAQPAFANVTVYRDLKGNASITGVEALETHSSSEVAAFVDTDGPDAENAVVIPVGSVTYLIPDGVSGIFDVYLTTGSAVAQSPLPAYSFAVNGGEPVSVLQPDSQTAESSTPDTDAQEAEAEDSETQAEENRILLCKGLSLESGDTLTVTATFGTESGSVAAPMFPAFGALLLFPAG